MRSDLQHGFDAVNQQRTDLQRLITILSDAQMNWTPRPDILEYLRYC